MGESGANPELTRNGVETAGAVSEPECPYGDAAQKPYHAFRTAAPRRFPGRALSGRLGAGAERPASADLQ
ncbi:hypothetical protein, partial [Streptomyces anulatus]